MHESIERVGRKAANRKCFCDATRTRIFIGCKISLSDPYGGVKIRCLTV